MQYIVGLDDGLAPDERQAITQRNCVIYTFSGYEYALISEWTRLFGLLRILDNSDQDKQEHSGGFKQHLNMHICKNISYVLLLIQVVFVSIGMSMVLVHLPA